MTITDTSPPPSLIIARLFLLLFFIGSIFTLPIFIIHMTTDDCLQTENLGNFDDVNENECAQITGVRLGPKNEYVTVEVKSDNSIPIMLDFQSEVKDATLTHYDLQNIVMEAAVPSEIAAFEKSIDDLEVTAIEVAKGESFDESDILLQLDTLKTDFDSLTTKYKETQRLIMLETSKVMNYSGPNPTKKDFGFNFDKRLNQGLLAGLHPTTTDCNEIQKEIKTIKRIKTQLEKAYSETPIASIDYEAWPNFKTSNVLPCLVAAIPDVKRLIFWHDLEINRKSFRSGFLSQQDLEIITLKGQKIKLPNTFEGQEFALDISERPGAWWKGILFPICVVISILLILITRRMGSK